MNTNKGEGAPKFGKPKPKKPELPRYAIVPHRGKGRVLKYDGQGYFLIKIPSGQEILAHRVDLTFTNKADKPRKGKGKNVPDQGAAAS